ncbi:hypothetical protein CTheo_8994 [Ceratobasidium theobromae]|uniref:Nephrocystin 3-like N-terminal domain-containing protein n=1 Tax=Ceratobasidium theobromae TaxID=1582974 RepID=A0A5N5Q841_9AGAM|nr:hypothetical protein CTheo_8994 [Ceratobasidium theobromae]
MKKARGYAAWLAGEHRTTTAFAPTGSNQWIGFVLELMRRVRQQNIAKITKRWHQKVASDLYHIAIFETTFSRLGIDGDHRARGNYRQFAVSAIEAVLTAHMEPFKKRSELPKINRSAARQIERLTTVAYTLCQVLQSPGQLAASLFRTRSSPECGDGNRIVPTIAYQLGHCSTLFLSALDRGTKKHLEANSSTISAQFELPLKDPLFEVKDKLPNNLVVSINVLDECEDELVANQILVVLFRLARNLPLKFFITSRPDTAIRKNMIPTERMQLDIPST